MDDLKGVLDDAHGHELLAVVAAVHHEGGGETLDNWALRLAEALNLVATSGVGQVLSILLLDSNVILGEEGIQMSYVCMSLCSGQRIHH